MNLGSFQSSPINRLPSGGAEVEPALDQIFSDLAHPASEVRAAAAYTLGQYREQWAMVALLHILTDPDATVREEAAYALGESEDVGAVVGLLVACDDSDAAVRRTAAEALVKLRTHHAPRGTIEQIDAEPPGQQ